ncbi:MAG: ABC-type transport auxiliary lipoprotein family protein [Candidatus Acidiferrales bacterium]
MPKRRIHRACMIVLLAAIGMTSACGAARPMKYYVLDSSPAPVNSPSAVYPVTLLVGHFTASHLYRDVRMVYGQGNLELGTYEYERWAQPPADMIEDILISSLRSTGQYRSVSGLSSNVRGDYIVRGHLYSLYEVDKPVYAARFSLQIELFDPKSRTTVWSKSYTQDQPIQGKTVQDIVEALDKNVNAGIQQLTTELGQYFASLPPQPASGN